ncbi:MAG: tRNA dihydrouridine(20/20a) synthase DusA [Betaproteobacteria bacterium]|nr:tRNA dihydrouridine(20/20a) synthase DusA [Betaproteobacteria bacterium]
MMDWTDRHCRYFLRQVAPQVRLYTEMITTGALLHGDVERHLGFDPAEHPVAVQLGGSEPDELARCARMAAERGYDEINLNVGCPSERVQRGAFGACLMAEPALIAECVRAMRAAVALPVTVKHRIGIGRVESYEFMRDFVGTVAEAGCGTFIVHARNAILQGLSPKENREVPPLRYDLVYRLKREFPHLEIVINGGIATRAQTEAQLALVDGVMLGRAAYHDPWVLAAPGRTRAEVVQAMIGYAEREIARGVALRHVCRHMLGLYLGRPGARQWRRMLSDPARLSRNDPYLLVEALRALESAAKEMPHERSPQVQVG